MNERYPNVSWMMRERSVRMGKNNYIRCRDIVVFPTYAVQAVQQGYLGNYNVIYKQYPQLTEIPMDASEIECFVPFH